MGRTAFFIKQQFRATNTTISGSPMALGNSDAPPVNILDDRPRLAWMNSKGVFAPTQKHGAVTAPGVYLDIEEGGGGEVNVGMQFPVPQDAHGFASSVQTYLNAASGLSLTYSVIYDSTNGRFTISASGSFEILWRTGVHGTTNYKNANLGPWMGFTTWTDSGSRVSHTGNEKRFDTELTIVVQAGTRSLAKTAIDLFAAFAWGSDRTEGGTNYSEGNEQGSGDMRVFGHTTNLGHGRTNWEKHADIRLDFSKRPGGEHNKIQVAYDPDGDTMLKTYWCFSWRFFDEEFDHAVGLFQGLQRVTTTTRQITQLAGHGLVDPTTSLSTRSYYPVQNMIRWVAPLNFDNWGAEDFRDVVQETVKQGKSQALAWSLRWNKILDGTYDPNDEADLGFLFWGSIQDYSQGEYGGAGENQYISGELELEQVR